MTSLLIQHQTITEEYKSAAASSLENNSKGHKWFSDLKQSQKSIHVCQSSSFLWVFFFLHISCCCLHVCVRLLPRPSVPDGVAEEVWLRSDLFSGLGRVCESGPVEVKVSADSLLVMLPRAHGGKHIDKERMKITKRTKRRRNDGDGRLMCWGRDAEWMDNDRMDGRWWQRADRWMDGSNAKNWMQFLEAGRGF